MNRSSLIHLLEIGGGTLAATLVLFCGWHLGLFVGLFVLLTLIEVCRPKRPGAPWDYMSIVYIMFCFLYVYVPWQYLQMPPEFRRSGDPATWEVFTVAGCVLLSFLSITVGYSFGRRRLLPFAPGRPTPPDLILKLSGVGLLLFGLASFLGYADIYGGVAELFRQADMIRAGIVGGNGMVFLRHFLPFANIGLWVILFTMWENKAHRWLKILIALPLVGVVLVSSLATAGRIEVLFIFLPVILAPLLLVGRRPSPVAGMILFAVLLSWAGYGDMLFESISYGTPLDFQVDMRRYYVFIREFTHPFESLISALREVPRFFPVRGFSDIPEALIGLVPEKLLGIDRPPNSVSTLNTFLLINVSKAIIPPGLIGYFYHCLMLPGIVIGSVLFGFAISKFENFFLQLMQNDRFYAYLYVAFGASFAHLIMAGDPEVYTQSYFWLYSGALALFAVRRVGAAIGKTGFLNVSRSVPAEIDSLCRR